MTPTTTTATTREQLRTAARYRAGSTLKDNEKGDIHATNLAKNKQPHFQVSADLTKIGKMDKLRHQLFCWQSTREDQPSAKYSRKQNKGAENTPPSKTEHSPHRRRRRSRDNVYLALIPSANESKTRTYFLADTFIPISWQTSSSGRSIGHFLQTGSDRRKWKTNIQHRTREEKRATSTRWLHHKNKQKPLDEEVDPFLPTSNRRKTNKQINNDALTDRKLPTTNQVGQIICKLRVLLALPLLPPTAALCKCKKKEQKPQQKQHMPSENHQAIIGAEQHAIRESSGYHGSRTWKQYIKMISQGWNYFAKVL